MRQTFLAFICLLLAMQSFSQKGQLNAGFTKLSEQIREVDTDDSALLTQSGLNVLLQRRALQYLTGASDLALAKFYASYTTDNDKLNLGLNFPIYASDNSLWFVVNPILESDVIKNFSKLYDNKNKWANNIRGGFKFTWLFGNGSLNFYDNEELSRKADLVQLRKKKFDELKSTYDKEEAERGVLIKALHGKEVTTSEPKKLKPVPLKKKERALLEAVGTAEADFVEKERTYASFHTGWLSAWTFFPLSPAEYWITPGRPVDFSKVRYRNWEVNLQYTHMLDVRVLGTFYGSIGIRRFQNNSVLAEQMTNVDFNRYVVYPPTVDTLNYSQQSTKKGYVGNYKEFMTSTLNVQLVHTWPVTWSVKPGISVRYEKNIGDYSAANWRIGVPLTIQGKDKPVTIELQYRLNDVGNYQKKGNHETGRTFGISLGLPIVALYK